MNSVQTGSGERLIDSAAQELFSQRTADRLKEQRRIAEARLTITRCQEAASLVHSNRMASQQSAARCRHTGRNIQSLTAAVLALARRIQQDFRR